MVLNSEKCLYLIINKEITNESIELGNKTLRTKAEQKLLDIVDKDSKIEDWAMVVQISLKSFVSHNQRRI